MPGQNNVAMGVAAAWRGGARRIFPKENEWVSTRPHVRRYVPVSVSPLSEAEGNSGWKGRAGKGAGERGSEVK